MSDRAVILIVLAGMVFATMVWLLGYQFYYWSYFDPDKPYLPEGSDQVVNSVSAMMNGSQTLIAAIVTAIVTWKVASKSHEAGQNAAQSQREGGVTDGNNPRA
jgi:hypothetical protein